jgi:hypothetical protein
MTSALARTIVGHEVAGHDRVGEQRQVVGHGDDAVDALSLVRGRVVVGELDRLRLERLDDAVEEGRSDQPDARTHEVLWCCEGMPDPDEEALLSG